MSTLDLVFPFGGKTRSFFAFKHEDHGNLLQIRRRSDDLCLFG